MSHSVCVMALTIKENPFTSPNVSRVIKTSLYTVFTTLVFGIIMKLSPDSTFLLIVLLTCVELFVTAHPANRLQGKKGLQILEKEMRKLWDIVSKEKKSNNLMDFEQSLISLPSLNVKTEDLESLEVSRTLAQLYSGLKSFKFHLDWIQQKQDEMGNDDSNTKEIIDRIQHINNILLRQIGTPPSELIHRSLPPLKTAWNLYQANVEIQDKLYYFCHWYLTALRVLRHRQQ